MKYNLLFGLLTAVILAVGFYAVNGAELLVNNSAEGESFVSIEKTDTGAVYLSGSGEVIDPMSGFATDDTFKPGYAETLAASAAVKAMSSHNNATKIAMSAGKEQLFDSWQRNDDHMLIVNGWKYLNPNHEERLLDCVFNGEDMSLVYIRFYNEDKTQPSAFEMNRALEELDKQSDLFYSYLDDNAEYLKIILDEIFNDLNIYIKDSLYHDYSNPYLYPYYYREGLTDEYGRVNIYDGATLNFYFNYMYHATSEAMCNSGIMYDSSMFLELMSFWMPPVSLVMYPLNFRQTMDIDEKFPVGFEVNMNIPVLEALLNNRWLRSSYTAQDGRIYQTMELRDNTLTVIYSVKEKMIEGYYFR